ncbi:MAG TPA: hypothetical protein VE129_20455 [Thermoanaerobaculia bacterium]|nr:hypothetical protein [Thermoanaerobaculia bacterium]
MPPGLGEVLAESGDLTLRRLRKASDWRRVHGGTIDRALLATGAVSEETLLDALEQVTGLPSVSRERLAAASREAVESLPTEARRRLRALPFDRRGNVLSVAVVDPGNPVLETGLVASTGCVIRLHVTADPILEDVLRIWESAKPKVAGPSAPRVSPADPVAPFVPASAAAHVRNRHDPAIELDPFARLARALLVDAIDDGAQAVEIGPEGKGALLRTYAGGVAQTSRPLPLPVLEPLFAWFLARTRPPGPFDEGGLILERAGRRVRVEATVDATGTAWLVLEPAPRSPMVEHEICLHDDTAEGDVFCPSCGTSL